MTSTLRAATVQFRHRASDKAYNLARVAAFAHHARAAGAELALMPEMCITGYWHIPGLDAAGLAGLAEPEDGPSLRRVARLAARLDLAIGVGWLESAADGQFYNAYRLCLPDGSGHTHRKLHAFEHPLIRSGDGFTVFDTPWGVRMAILICWDNNLVENVRACALDGADILLAPHQTGGTHSRSPHGMKPIPLDLWEGRHEDPEPLRRAFAGPNGREWLLRWLPARAHDNGVFVLFSNGVGRDEDELRTGNAMILDPYGRIVAESRSIADDIVIADLDLTLVRSSSGRRWMTGRRPELYAALTRRTGKERSARATRFDLAE
ncbi:nitrilase-related carbon-nitrogen hydrolase [Sphingomonas alpina]|uniref:Acyltransferase n=1 Tax=Sphingomonas alpina TaxID=653931 RepID=A0A7H0LNX9_9SPHN|nr:nitrilase-related carbon-nitrogen hydrolase [Sphingomonas alpina]QNQ11382.1 acyltransferase [Sphingomonas alpina]